VVAVGGRRRSCDVVGSVPRVRVAISKSSDSGSVEKNCTGPKRPHFAASTSELTTAVEGGAREGRVWLVRAPLTTLTGRGRRVLSLSSRGAELSSSTARAHLSLIKRLPTRSARHVKNASLRLVQAGQALRRVSSSPQCSFPGVALYAVRANGGKAPPTAKENGNNQCLLPFVVLCSFWRLSFLSSCLLLLRTSRHRDTPLLPFPIPETTTYTTTNQPTRRRAVRPAQDTTFSLFFHHVSFPPGILFMSRQ
jgi:hypothetical protein